MVNFVFGILDEPMEQGKAYLFSTATVDAANAETMAQFFNDSVALLWPNGTRYKQILLIVTDAASNMSPFPQTNFSLQRAHKFLFFFALTFQPETVTVIS